MATTTNTKTNRVDVYTRVTSRIIEELERGTRPWLKPWQASHLAGRICRPLRHNAQPYSGINILMLWAVAEEHGFISPFWLTYRQAQELGGNVKKGEHGSPVVYANTFKKTETNDAGEEIEQEIPYLKEYTVFCADQIEGLPQHFYQLAEPPKEKMERIEVAERFFANTGADIRTGGNQAYYACEPDYIRMPPFEAFKDAASFASTLGHECVHWTRNSKRLNRDFGRKRFGDEGYAMEEMVVRRGGAFVGV